VHHYATNLTWNGSTGDGYEKYSRQHRLTAPPAADGLDLSSDPAFRGDPALLNPEQLLVAAAASCQMLSFLSVAARSRIDVIGYTDEATAVMDEGDAPARINTIQLNPVVTLTDNGGTRADDERLHRMAEIAHRSCFIANSLTSDVRVASTFRWSD
jgi:organic hydroperoxide reductase OsmC/OhrA